MILCLEGIKEAGKQNSYNGGIVSGKGESYSDHNAMKKELLFKKLCIAFDIEYSNSTCSASTVDLNLQ